MMVEQSGRLECMEIRIVRWICGVPLRDRVPSAELRERMGMLFCYTDPGPGVNFLYED